jgi:thioredoxin 1
MATQIAEAERVVSLDDDDIGAVVGDSGVVLAEFYTEWCGTCKRMTPVLEGIAADTDATVLTVDIEAHLETAIEYGAQITPTFVLFVDGRPVKQRRGGQTEQSLRELIGKYSE